MYPGVASLQALFTAFGVWFDVLGVIFDVGALRWHVSTSGEETSHSVLFGERREILKLGGDPSVIMSEFACQQFRDGPRHLHGCVGVEEERAGAAGKYVFDASSHFRASGPDNFGPDVG